MNGAIVQFYGFSRTDSAALGDDITYPPEYMLVKVLHDIEGNIHIPGLPVSVVPIKTKRFTYGKRKGRHVTLEQFPVTVAYAITDYKCQGQTYYWAIVDLKRPTGRGGRSVPSSAYVQLSRAKALNQLSIILPFDERDLWEPLPVELIEELKWEEEMAVQTASMYP